MTKILNIKFYKTIGFYFSLASIVCLIIAVTTYTFGFQDSLLEYNKSNVMIVSIIGLILFFGLLIIKYTSEYSALLLWALSFVSMLLYIFNIYMYFTGVFYNGVTPEALKLIDPIVIVSSIFFILSVIISNIAMYLRHSNKEVRL